VLIPAIGRTPDDPKLRREAGLICLRYGKEPEGLRWLLSALEAAPRDEPTHAALADYYERQGDRRRAEAHRRLAGSGKDEG
jgi:Tfp pilus assembly protein PilF